MQGRLIMFGRLRPILEEHFSRTVEFLPEGMGVDADGEPSPPICAFVRKLPSGETVISTVVVPDAEAPLFAGTLRSFLARLRLTVDDVVPHL